MTSLVPHRIGTTQLLFTSLTSTNQFALELVSKTRPTPGTVVSASFQSAGRGQIGRDWVSERGKNACFSVVLYPAVPATDQFLLNASVALALRNVVAAVVPGSVTIKWPNDIYIEDSKVAGILIQNAVAGTRLRYSIAGIGLNVNQTRFPDDLPNPTSLRMECDRWIDLAWIRRQVCHALEAALQPAADSTEILRAYQLHLYQSGRRVWFEETDSGIRFEAQIVRVDGNGKLRLLRAGQETAYAFNEIKMIMHAS